MKLRRQIPGIVLLFLLLFTYRFSFREDFRILEMLQISLSTLSDVLLITVCTNFILRSSAMFATKYRREVSLLLTVPMAVIIYWISVQILIAIHRQIYLSTTGMTERFRSIFDSLSYQVFDSYLVIAVGIVVLVAHRLYVQWKEQKRLAETLKRERTQAELNFLKAQINPHFIFNTLNNVQFLIDESNDKARKLVQDFGDLLRYQLYETGNAYVSVNQEIKYLKQYIEIQKVRKEEGFEVNTHFDDFNAIGIAPLLLIIPLENAFKYSPNSDHGYIRIDLNLRDNQIVYRVENPVSNKGHSALARGGLGIDNLKKRLDLIYGDKASFHLDITESKATALLTIKTRHDEA